MPELLSPAGSFDALVAAVAAGADAIYVGGRRFGARAFAKNFDISEMSRAVSYCHLHGVRLYVTLNTLIEDREIREAVEYAAELWRLGVDALIVSDVGIIREIRKALPEFELHASTQMSVHSTDGARAAFGLGCSRVVLARELSLSDISSVVEGSPAEVEVFLHGALCVSYSGQCLFSSMVGGRSGNRGECAQPCRLPYKTPIGAEYPLSLKDLSYAEHIPELIRSGVASLKIEGRMKSAGYVYTVTSVYRRLLDEGRSATAAELDVLRKAFSRDGFTDGYLVGKIGVGMLGTRSESDKEESRRTDSIVIEPERRRVLASVRIASDKPSEMRLYNATRSVTVFGETAAPAQSSPLTVDSVKERLSRMGNTYLSLEPADIELELEDGVNLAPSAINSLRREAAEKFSDFGREPSAIGYEYEAARGGDTARIVTAEFYRDEEYLLAKKYSPKLLSELDVAFVPLGSSDEAIRECGGVLLPAVITDGELASVKKRLSLARELGARYAMAQNIGQIELARSLGFEKVFGGFRLNACSSAAKAQYLEMGVDALILSPELTLPKARDISGGIITYGRIPLMITERCFVKDTFGCASCGKAALTDRRGEKFPMMREAAHRSLILNSALTYMGDKTEELSRARLYHRHLIFTVESAEEIISALGAHSEGDALPCEVRRMGRRQALERSEKREDKAQPRQGEGKPRRRDEKHARGKSGGSSFASRKRKTRGK